MICEICKNESDLLDPKVLFFPEAYRITIESDYIFCKKCLSKLLQLLTPDISITWAGETYSLSPEKWHELYEGENK